MMVLIYILSALYFAYVNSQLWEWFVTPLGVPALSYFQTLGIQILWVSFSGLRGGMWADLIAFDKNKREDPTRHMAIGLVAAIFTPVLAHLGGWVAHYLMLHPITFGA